MSNWQKCPICEGTGYVAYPYGTAAGQTWSSTDCSNKQCHRCDGTGTSLPAGIAQCSELSEHSVISERTEMK